MCTYLRGAERAEFLLLPVSGDKVVMYVLRGFHHVSSGAIAIPTDVVLADAVHLFVTDYKLHHVLLFAAYCKLMYVCTLSFQGTKGLALSLNTRSMALHCPPLKCKRPLRSYHSPPSRPSVRAERSSFASFYLSSQTVIVGGLATFVSCRGGAIVKILMVTVLWSSS